MRPLLSPNGTLTAEPRTNRLDVHDLPDHLDEIERRVRELDHRPSQFVVDLELFEHPQAGGPSRPQPGHLRSDVQDPLWMPDAAWKRVHVVRGTTVDGAALASMLSREGTRGFLESPAGWPTSWFQLEVRPTSSDDGGTQVEVRTLGTTPGAWVAGRPVVRAALRAHDQLVLSTDGAPGQRAYLVVVRVRRIERLP